MSANYIPFEWLKKKYKQTDRKYIYIFVSTFLIGFFTHFYFLSNKFINHDVLLNTFFYDREDYSIFIASGRWAYMLFNGITSGFCMPQVKGLAALVYMAVSAVLIAKILKIQNTFLGILIGGIFITFPSTACNFSYSFSVDTYSLSFLIAIFSVYLIEKNQKKIIFLAAATILGFSIGIYQSSITFSIALIFILLLSEALSNVIIIKEFLIRISRFVFFLFLGLAIYFIFSKSVMFVMDISASTYRSMDSITQFSLTGLLKGLLYSYANFAAYYFMIYYLYSGFLICNQAYDRLNTRYENIYAYLNRIAARMEETPEWSHDIPVYFANPSYIFNANYEVEIKAYDDLKRMMGTDQRHIRKGRI